MGQTILHKSYSPPPSSPLTPIANFTQVLWQQARDEAAGVDTLEAVVEHLQTGGSGHRDVYYWTETAAEFGSRLSGLATLFRIALLNSTAIAADQKRCKIHYLSRLTLARRPQLVGIPQQWC